MKLLLTLLLTLCLSMGSALAQKAAVAMPDRYSADVAELILARGGNAIDAAVASAFVLAVTYPEAGNLGGGGFMTLYARPKQSGDPKTVQSRQAYFLDYREKAPLAASRDMYLDDRKKVIPYKSLVGYQASGVPGTVMGLWEAHQRFGVIPWNILLQPAIELAAKGFEIEQKLVNTVNWYQKWIEDKSDQPLNFSSYFGRVKAGDTFRQPELAETLRRIANEGPQDFYRGETAHMLVTHMQKQGGLISLKDMHQYEVKWREPVEIDWQSYQLISAPPPSSGGIAIAQLLKMYSILKPEYEQAWQKAEKEGIPQQAFDGHFYAEMSKRVYADRAVYLGDPDFYPVPVKKLLNDTYLQKRVADIQFDAISESEKIRPGLAESPDTTHFSIVDAEGNAVSNTYTLNMPFGSGVVIEGAGFLMNDEMDDFSTKPGVANVFGVVGGKANEIQPEKRMLSSMSPTIMLKNGEVSMVVGTPGGSSIITSVFQVIINVIEKRMTPQQAVDQPRMHHQLLPKDQIAHHPDLPVQTKASLELMGYQLKENNYLGDVQLITVTDQGFGVASDKRGRGDSRVFDVDK